MDFCLDCPIGRYKCDTCTYHGSTGCSYDKASTLTVSNNQWKEFLIKRYNELMAMPKEDLVRMIMGDDLQIFSDIK